MSMIKYKVLKTIKRYLGSENKFKTEMPGGYIYINSYDQMTFV